MKVVPTNSLQKFDTINYWFPHLFTFNVSNGSVAKKDADSTLKYRVDYLGPTLRMNWREFRIGMSLSPFQNRLD
jgi:hypothetical protein